MTKALRKLLTLVLLCSFVFQLAALAPRPSIPQTAYGEIVTVAPKEKVLLPKSIYEASYSDYYPDAKNALVFTGDVMLARNVEFLIDHSSSSFPYERIDLKSLAERPAIIGNFESAMPAMHEVTPPLAMRFSVKPECLDALHESGFSHVSLANNHSNDYGADGYMNAVAMLESHQITAFGSGVELNTRSITYINTDAGVVALVAVNASQQDPDPLALARTFTVATRHSDYQIAFIHWGTEYELTHTSYQEDLAHELVSDGADLIVGHHPHVTEDIGLVDGVVVFYSLGNFVFDQYFNPDVQKGLVLMLSMGDEPSVDILPVTSEEHHSQPSFMDGNERAAFLRDIAQRSEPSLREDIQHGILPLRQMVASSQKNAIIVR